jgi:DNA-binding CsgD family transcriptional regulator
MISRVNEQGQGLQRTDARPYITEIAALTDHFNAGNGSFEGYLPATIVERDRVLPFKRERTDELVEDLKATRERDGWGNGQDSPMLAAYVLGQEVPTVEVYDGLHRQLANEVFQNRHGVERDRPAAIVAAIGSAAVHFVTVKPMTEGAMLGKRLTNTSNHPELRFARGGLWTARLWYLDPISELAPDISPKQAFYLAARKQAEATNVGRRLGLNPDSVEAITAWAKQKADEWSVDPSTVYKWIHRAESTSPEVIAQVRNTGKGRRVSGIITEQMVMSLTSLMGGEDLKVTHNVVVDFSLRHGLSNAQFSDLLTLVMDPSNVARPSDPEQVGQFLTTLDPADLRTDGIARTEHRIRPRTDIFRSGAAAVASVVDAIDRVAESLAVRDNRDEFVPTIDQRKAAIAAAESLELQAEKALELAEKARRRAEGGNADNAVERRHLVAAADFNPEEYKDVLSERDVEILQLIANGLSNDQVGRQLYITADTVKTHLRRAFQRLGVDDRTEAVIRAIQIGEVQIAGISSDVSEETKKEPPATAFSEQLDALHEQLEVMSRTSGLQLSPEKIASLQRTAGFLGRMHDRITTVRSLLQSVISNARVDDPGSRQ